MGWRPTSQKVLLDSRVNGRLAVGDLLECPADFGGAGVLGQATARAGAQCVDDGAVIGVGGEHEHLDAGIVFAEAAGRLDALAARHAQVRQHHIR
jgi:hypothetical protein